MKRPTRKNVIIVIAALVCAGLLGLKVFGNKQPAPQPQVQSTNAAAVTVADVPRFYHGLGTVTALQDTIVRSRVDGYLTAIHFKEGQYVQEGDILVEIDQRPFQNKLAEAKGALVRDEALLRNARQDLERYRKLLRQDAVPVQQVQSQEALVGQYEGAVIQDKAAIADAELQLAYSKVTAPFSGKAGLRQVDIGATISSGDSQGIVRLTQTRPCYVVFTLIDKYLPHVREAMRNRAAKQTDGLSPVATASQKNETITGSKSEPKTASRTGQNGGTEANPNDVPHSNQSLPVQIWSQDNKQLLGHGFLESLDNQIDISTGTIKAKALVTNEDDHLFPNQFVNVQLHVDTLRNVLTIPTAAVQRSNTGYFVYKIVDGKAKLTPITIDFSNDRQTVVATGLAEGDIVVTDGVDNLRDGSLVTYTLSTPVDNPGVVSDESKTPPESVTKPVL